jgi:hypothetical protein
MNVSDDVRVTLTVYGQDRETLAGVDVAIPLDLFDAGKEAALMAYLVPTMYNLCEQLRLHLDRAAPQV